MIPDWLIIKTKTKLKTKYVKTIICQKISLIMSVLYILKVFFTCTKQQEIYVNFMLDFILNFIEQLLEILYLNQLSFIFRNYIQSLLCL